MVRETRNKKQTAGHDLAATFQSQMKVFEEKLDAASKEEDPKGSVEALKTEFKKFQNEITLKLDMILCNINKSFENLSQKMLNRNIIILGIEENDNEDLFLVVTEVIKGKLNIDLRKNEINTYYRLGKKSSDAPSGSKNAVKSKHRRIAVEFVNEWKRDEVFKNKSKLKNSGVIIVEMLSKGKLDLFKIVKEKFKKSYWTTKGNIKVFINNKTQQIDDIEQYNKLS